MEEKTLVVEIVLNPYVCSISCPYLQTSVSTPFVRDFPTDREKIHYLLLALSRAVAGDFPPTIANRTWN